MTYEESYHEFHPRLLRFFRGHGIPSADADDAAAEVALHIWEAGDYSQHAWLYVGWLTLRRAQRQLDKWRRTEQLNHEWELVDARPPREGDPVRESLLAKLATTIAEEDVPPSCQELRRALVCEAPCPRHAARSISTLRRHFARYQSVYEAIAV